MGSEMCIRDRLREAGLTASVQIPTRSLSERLGTWWSGVKRDMGCLLYTSDAADERSSVDLGGRRIIKKKKVVNLRGWGSIHRTAE